MDSKDYHREYNRQRYHAKKAECIALLGGVCVHCGIDNKLHIDHKDAKDKTLDLGKLLNFSKERVFAELEKCQLLCEDCHIQKTKDCKDGYHLRAKGHSVHSSKLVESQVRDIISRSEFENISALSREFKVSRSTIRFIITRKTWKHLIL